MRFIRITVFCLCILLCMLFLIGCAASYEVIEEDGRMYLDFRNVKKNSHDGYEPGLKFQSVFELCSRVLSGQLDEYEINHMYNSFGTSSAEKLEIMNLRKAQEPVLADGLCLRGQVEWFGEYYDISLGSEEPLSNEFHGFFSYGSEASYEEYKKMMKSTDGAFVYSTEYVADRSAKATTYSTGTTKFKNVEYTLQSEEKELYVLEIYILETSTNLTASDTLPYRVCVFGRKSGHYFYYILSYIGIRPSVEWLNMLDIQDVPLSEG